MFGLEFHSFTFCSSSFFVCACVCFYGSNFNCIPSSSMSIEFGKFSDASFDMTMSWINKKKSILPSKSLLHFVLFCCEFSWKVSVLQFASVTFAKHFLVHKHIPITYTQSSINIECSAHFRMYAPVKHKPNKRSCIWMRSSKMVFGHVYHSHKPLNPINWIRAVCVRQMFLICAKPANFWCSLNNL